MRTFGLRRMARDQVITRGPRFQIAFDANASELDSTFAQSPGQKYRLGSRQISPFGNYSQGDSGPINDTRVPGVRNPQVQGRYELMRCKVDSVSLGIMPGRRVAAVRWEGVAEGITFVPQSLQTFKQNLQNPNVERVLSAAPTINQFPPPSPNAN